MFLFVYTHSGGFQTNPMLTDISHWRADSLSDSAVVSPPSYKKDIHALPVCARVVRLHAGPCKTHTYACKLRSLVINTRSHRHKVTHTLLCIKIKPLFRCQVANRYTHLLGHKFCMYVLTLFEYVYTYNHAYVRTCSCIHVRMMHVCLYMHYTHAYT